MQPLQQSISQNNPVPEISPLHQINHIPQNLDVQFPQNIQIPRLNVPQFHGCYEEWTSFRDLFVAAVHSNQTLQPVYKLQYLKSLLKGDAEILLKHTPVTNEHYEIALANFRRKIRQQTCISNNAVTKTI